MTIIHNPFNTIRDHLVHPKDKTPDLDQCGIIYELPCQQCDVNYIGESGRSLKIRLHEHQTQRSSAFYEHSSETGHNIHKDKIKIITKEDYTYRRKIKEAVEIRTLNPALNRDDGNTLPVIYNQLLFCKRKQHDESCDSMLHVPVTPPQ